uniref:Estradiol 17-beta-dehydrogenase 11 n=1 Tax=Monodelphis domestica TaxID=13616 RepID=A0A5F8GF72_MONDO
MHILLDLLLLIPILIFSTVESFVKLLIPKKRKSVSGEIVLITGAGHGIGRLTAYEFAKLKSKLVLWDINKHGIEETAAECRKLGARAHAYVVDCSNREEIYNYAKKTTKAFLPAMMKNNHGHIITVASAGGHTVVPFLLAYCSSKFAAVGFHRALTAEMAALGKNGIKTSCLCPNFINTGFIKNPSTRFIPTLEPEEVVSKLMKGILTEQKMIFVPSSLSVVIVLERIFPERFLNAMRRIINVKFDAVIGFKNKVQ